MNKHHAPQPDDFGVAIEGSAGDGNGNGVPPPPVDEFNDFSYVDTSLPLETHDEEGD